MAEEREEKDPNKWKKPPVDPAIADVLQAVRKYSNDFLYSRCYLSRSTIARLRKVNGTRRPQHMTLTGVLGAVGLEYGIRRKK
jgi:hypothetical protein